jgi:hypothetical protein
MSNKNLNNGMPDQEMLRRYFEGKLNPQEHQSMTVLLEEDEFIREAFGNLNAGQFAVVEKISVSVNERLKNKFGHPPVYMNWKIWLSVFIGLIFITGIVAMKDWEEKGKVSENRKSNENLEHKQKNIDKNNSNQNTSTEMKVVATNETTMMFDSPNTETENKLAILKKKDSVKSEKKVLEEKKIIEDGPDENSIDQKVKDQKTNDATTIDSGKKIYRLRIGDAAVLTTQNLAEKEANSGEERDNTDVRDFNIGDPATNKKNTSFKLEDMPHYKGGDEALAGYVKGKIALKSYPSPQSGFSTVVEFIVNSKGKVSDIKFQNPLDPNMEKDITEILSNVSFVPGKKSGKKGSMHYMMALMFE